MIERENSRKRGNSQKMDEYRDTEDDLAKPINFNRLFKDEIASDSDESVHNIYGR